MGNEHKLISWFFKTKAVVSPALLHPSLFVHHSVLVSGHTWMPAVLPAFVHFMLHKIRANKNVDHIFTFTKLALL